jgi:hypothetical protein
MESINVEKDHNRIKTDTTFVSVYPQNDFATLS